MLYIPDQLVPSLKIRWLGTILSAIAYGIVIILSGNCLHLLHKKRGAYSPHMRSFLFTYITVMLLLSTWTLIQSVLQILSLVCLLEMTPSMPITLALTIWGADGFMVKIPILPSRNEYLRSNIHRYGVVSSCIRTSLTVVGS